MSALARKIFNKILANKSLKYMYLNIMLFFFRIRLLYMYLIFRAYLLFNYKLFKNLKTYMISFFFI